MVMYILSVRHPDPRLTLPWQDGACRGPERAFPTAEKLCKARTKPTLIVEQNVHHLGSSILSHLATLLLSGNIIEVPQQCP